MAGDALGGGPTLSVSEMGEESAAGPAKLFQSSKSISSKKIRRERDISPGLPHSEFPAATNTFSGLGATSRCSIFHGFRKLRDVVSNFTTSLRPYGGNYGFFACAANGIRNSAKNPIAFTFLDCANL